MEDGDKVSPTDEQSNVKLKMKFLVFGEGPSLLCPTC